MQFTSLAFAIFLPMVFMMYWAAPAKARMPLLLLISYGFYLSLSPGYVLLLIFISFLTYMVGRHCNKKTLAFGIIVQIIILAFFKYVGLLPGIFQNIVIPVGISFYMFKSISYMVDVYKNEIEAETKVVPLFLYLAFFPDIVSGPINRAGDLIPQLKKDMIFDEAQAVYGMRLILWGLFQKLLIADTLAGYVNLVFEMPDAFLGISYVIVMFFYTIQIYCDFAGYSNMAIGIARLFGVVSMDNFKSPYLASDIREFWDRWHISLSTWLRDYVYIPLGGSRKGKVKTYFNLIITFLVSGIWHGGNLTFVVWGLLHGIYQVIYRIYRKYCKIRMPKIIGVIITFLAVSCAWMFFRADSVSQALRMFGHMFYNMDLMLAYRKLGMVKKDFYMLIVAILVLFGFDVANQKVDVLRKLDRLAVPVRYAIYLIFSIVILAYHIHNGTSQEFIYFKF